MKPRIKKTERQLNLTSPIKSNWGNRCKRIILYKLKCMMPVIVKKCQVASQTDCFLVVAETTSEEPKFDSSTIWALSQRDGYF